jgi:DNA-binding winged helix-turn-helix (wHTH) protein
MSDRYRFGPFEVDASEHTLSAQGRPVALTRRAFDTLLYLVRHPGRLVTREELIAAVWGETIVEEGNLHWTISAVRKALAQESEEVRIETVRGLGYRFLGPVERVGEAALETASPPAAPAPPRRPPRRLWLAGGLGAPPARGRPRLDRRGLARQRLGLQVPGCRRGRLPQPLAKRD